MQRMDKGTAHGTWVVGCAPARWAAGRRPGRPCIDFSLKCLCPGFQTRYNNSASQRAHYIELGLTGPRSFARSRSSADSVPVVAAADDKGAGATGAAAAAATAPLPTTADADATADEMVVEPVVRHSSGSPALARVRL